jgi:hypothetical protein
MRGKSTSSSAVGDWNVAETKDFRKALSTAEGNWVIFILCEPREEGSKDEYVK